MNDVQTVVAVLVTVFGVWSFLFPEKVVKFVGLSIESVIGYIEVKAIYGGLFTGLGAAALLVDTTDAYKVLGGGLLFMACARLLTIYLTKAKMQFDIISVSIFVELIGGFLLIAG